MTKNTETGNEGLENPMKIETEKLTEESNSINLSEIKETNQETENMEVHQHPQLHHDPKPWKEYFLEFIMITFAVTLGFFAENIRENIVEEERAKEYAQSLYDDLKIDTALIQRTYDEKEWIMAKFDSVGKMLESKDLSKYNEFIYYAERYIVFNDVFT